ncbi:hypothetical protein [Lysobacter sp. CA196]|uniref:hypothetical protein n=1 Tax=Lysobacter sp. CA196 TaxID=3455606 RepID=UPI003F8D1092
MAARLPSLPTLFVCALLAGALLACSAGACAAPAVVAQDPAVARNDERVIRVGDARLRVIVEGVADRERVDELQRWLAECADAALTAYGRLPLREAKVLIRQSRGTSRGSPRQGGRRGDPSPVPWGQTRRDDGVSVLLYVRPDAGIDELRDDWTAVHELSHLFHPYLGEDGRWLAEGLASYYQNVLRARAGQLDRDEAWRRLDAGFERGRNSGAGAPLGEIGWSRASTMRIYWGGAMFWLEADLALRRERRLDLDTVLSRYSRCCLDGDREATPEEFVAELDRLGGGKVFTQLFDRYAAMREFPSKQPAYRVLGLDSVDGSLRFSDRADAVRLRRAIMGPRAAATPSTR